MKQSIETIIDEDACIGCGECVRVCPSDTISIRNGKALLTGEKSLQCGQCAAVCPTGAVRVPVLENDALKFQTFTSDDRWLPFGDFDEAELLKLARSRRSCRCYKQTPVAREKLTDLARFGITAPSGTNSQQWTFTILPTRAHVLRLGEKISDFFQRLNRHAERIWLRNSLKWIGKPELHHYFHNHYESVRRALQLFRTEGADLLFHGATAVIVVASKPGASCPADDALLASQNMLLAAHAMGLGTCMIGYAVKSMQTDPAIQSHIGIPASETVYSVIALGYPDVVYQRMSGRHAPEIRFAG